MLEEQNTIEFIPGELYRNRIGWYMVLEIKGDEILARYIADGVQAKLTGTTQRRIIRNIKEEEKPKGAIDDNRETFFSYVEDCNNKYRYGHDLERYREIISRHRSINDINRLIDDDSFCSLVWDTLDAWNMDQRGAELVPKDVLQESIRSHRKQLTILYPCKLHDISENQMVYGILGSLDILFCGLKVMATKRRIVGVSKALHFLLPDLVIPIDGNYTLPYFWGYNKYDSTPEAEFNMFKYIFYCSYSITNKLQLTPSDITNEGWNTSVPKLIDDAVIGFFKRLESK